MYRIHHNNSGKKFAAIKEDNSRSLKHCIVLVMAGHQMHTARKVFSSCITTELKGYKKILRLVPTRLSWKERGEGEGGKRQEQTQIAVGRPTLNLHLYCVP